MLPDCLASCADGVDEMIIVDTGSSDRTVEIAESFGATVLHFPWNGSFSDARNARRRRRHRRLRSSGSTPTSGSRPGTRRGCASSPPSRGARRTGSSRPTSPARRRSARPPRTSRCASGGNRPPYRFSGAIHEQIRVSMPIDLPERFAISTLRIRHYGYLKSRIEERNKHERNLTLLLARAASGRRTTRSRTSTSAPSTSRWTTSRRRTTHLEESLPADPARAGLARDRATPRCSRRA